MANNNKRLVLEVDADQIDLRKMLKKDFLELSMKAISSANPNVNGSWFTKESMERSLGTFVNKPVLGYFKNDDFVSHNGEWVYDPETDSDYFDTSNGERILGERRKGSAGAREASRPAGRRRTRHAVQPGRDTAHSRLQVLHAEESWRRRQGTGRQLARTVSGACALPVRRHGGRLGQTYPRKLS